MTKRAYFGTLPDGRVVERICLETADVQCEILTWGGMLHSFRVGGMDLVLGFDTLDDTLRQTAYMGAIVGRCANRIGGAQVKIGDTIYPLSPNEGTTHIHGGAEGFDRRLWNAALLDDGVRLTLTSPHLDQGYPGELRVTATYTLRGATLTLTFEAVCDRDTLCNLTAHPYFNLDGGGDVLRHELTVFASHYTPNSDSGALPTGEIAPVAKTPFDFRSPTPIGARIDADFAQLHFASGYDHNFVLDNANGTLRPAAILSAGGRTLTIETTLPGLQVYSGNFLAGNPPGKGGAVYQNRAGVALEPQFFPDAPNHPNFPQPILQAGEVWRQEIRFSIQ